MPKIDYKDIEDEANLKYLLYKIFYMSNTIHPKIFIKVKIYFFKIMEENK